MKPSITIRGAVVSCMLAFGSTVQAEGASATMLAYTCAGCHGTNGVSAGPATPSLAGIPAEHMVETMAAFKSGERNETIMGRIAKGYSDEEFQTMAEFFSKQKFVPAKQKVDGGLAAKGEVLHEKYCEKCHSEGATSNEDDVAILAGQWTSYLRFTMTDFVDGDREMTKKMKRKVKKLRKEAGDDGIEQLIHFYGSRK